MTVTTKITCKAMVEQAYAEIETLSVSQALALYGNENVMFVDLRDIRELQREGKIPGALHMPRGMTEFWVDPQSPYFKEIFNQDKQFVFFCAKGWRSALATQTAQRIGLDNVCHFDGGFEAWKENDGAIEIQA